MADNVTPHEAPSVSQELSTRFFHPYIVSEIISHVDHFRDLVHLMKVSKAFYHEAGWRLYDGLYFDPPPNALCGWTEPDSPWSKASLLSRTKDFVLEPHDKPDCTAQCLVTHGEGQPRIRPLELPQLDFLGIIFTPQATCNGLDCPLSRNLRPERLNLHNPQHIAANTLPLNLFSNLTCLDIHMEDGSVFCLPRVLTMYVPPGSYKLDIFFRFDEDIGQTDQYLQHAAFRKACGLIVDILSHPDTRNISGVSIGIGRQGGPRPRDEEDNAGDLGDDDENTFRNEFRDYRDMWEEVMGELAEDMYKKVQLWSCY